MEKGFGIIGEAKRRWLELGARWVGRVVSGLLLSIFLLMAAGQGLPPPGLLSLCLAIALLGCVVAWFSDLGGSTLILGGAAGFYLINFWESGQYPTGPVFPLFFLPGILLFFCFLIEQDKVSFGEG